MIGEHISLAIDFIARLCGKVAPGFTRISGALEQKPRGRQPGPQLSLLAGGPEKGLSLAARICPFWQFPLKRLWTSLCSLEVNLRHFTLKLRRGISFDDGWPISCGDPKEGARTDLVLGDPWQPNARRFRL